MKLYKVYVKTWCLRTSVAPKNQIAHEQEHDGHEQHDLTEWEHVPAEWIVANDEQSSGVKKIVQRFKDLFKTK